MKTVKGKSITAFISRFPPKTRAVLNKMRAAIKKTAPKAVETISYGIPTFKLNGKNLIHFSGYDVFVSLYPGSQAIRVFKKELAKYELSKGTIRFPLDKPIPYGLIRKITRYRLKVENKHKI